MKVTRRRVYSRALSLLTIGILSLALWQGSAFAGDVGDVTEAAGTATTTTAADAAEDVTATAETTVAETVDTATTTVDAAEEETPDAEAIAEPTDVQSTAEADSDVDPIAAEETTQPSSAGDGSDTSSEGAPPAQTATTSSTSPSSAPGPRPHLAPAQAPDVSLEGTFVLSMRKKLNAQSDKDLDSLIAAGDEVEGTVVLGERIDSTSSNHEQDSPSTSSQLAFTGADLGSLLFLAGILLALGSRTARRRTPVRRVVRAKPVAHLRFAA